MLEQNDNPNRIRPELTKAEKTLEMGCIAVMTIAWFGLLNELGIIFNDISEKGVSETSAETIARSLTFASIIVSEYLASEEMNK